MELEDLRAKIDEVDGELTALLAKRLELVEQVAEYKKATGTPVLHTGREDEIVARIRKSGEYGDAIARIYRYLFEISRIRQTAKIGRALQVEDPTGLAEKIRDGEHVTVAVQGLSGAFSTVAKNRLFPKSRTRYYETFEDVFRALSASEADYGVIPTHNSNAGSVLEVYDYMSRYDTYIVDSLKLEVVQNLLALPGARREDIETVYSHPQSIAQCRGYLAERLPAARQVVMTNNAVAARFVAERGDARCAALGPAACAEEYGLSVLEACVQDSKFNCTNFVVLARRPNLSERNDKISIIVSLPHETGTLYKLLTKFYVNELNLTKIESRPIAGKDFEYLFYLDFNGNVLDRSVSSMLAGLAEELPYFKFLGNY